MQRRNCFCRFKKIRAIRTPTAFSPRAMSQMGRLDEARAIIARLRSITPRLVPSAAQLRSPADRELFLSGLREAVGEPNDLGATAAVIRRVDARIRYRWPALNLSRGENGPEGSSWSASIPALTGKAGSSSPSIWYGRTKRISPLATSCERSTMRLLAQFWRGCGSIPAPALLSHPKRGPRWRPGFSDRRIARSRARRAGRRVLQDRTAGPRARRRMAPSFTGRDRALHRSCEGF